MSVSEALVPVSGKSHTEKETRSQVCKPVLDLWGPFSFHLTCLVPPLPWDL